MSPGADNCELLSNTRHTHLDKGVPHTAHAADWEGRGGRDKSVPLQEQIEQASLAAHDAMWAAAEKDTPPYWAKGEEYHGRL